MLPETRQQDLAGRDKGCFARVRQPAFRAGNTNGHLLRLRSGLPMAGSSANSPGPGAREGPATIAQTRIEARDAGHRWISTATQSDVARRRGPDPGRRASMNSTLVRIRKLAVRYRRGTDPDLRGRNDDDANLERQLWRIRVDVATRRPPSAPGHHCRNLEQGCPWVDAGPGRSGARHLVMIWIRNLLSRRPMACSPDTTPKGTSPTLCRIPLPDRALIQSRLDRPPARRPRILSGWNLASPAWAKQAGLGASEGNTAGRTGPTAPG